jgi:hypothetical protein
VPPIAVEALLDYCYKDKSVLAPDFCPHRLPSFCQADYENGYSRNLLWRLWRLAGTLGIHHLLQLCSQVTHRLKSIFCEILYVLVHYSLIWGFM